MEIRSKRSLMIANGWVQAAGIVLIVGFLIMGILTYYTYTDEPPIPQFVKDAKGLTLFTSADIMAGQGIFLGNGLMEYGSIFGHGAYLGPDFTTEYLHRAALSSNRIYGETNSDTAAARTIRDFKANRYDETTGTLTYTDSQARAFEECRAYYASFFGNPTSKFGLRPNAIRDPEQIRKLTAFFSWTAWAASTARPGHSYSYTNNWPPEALVGNTPRQTRSCGACCRWSRCWAGSVCAGARSAVGIFSAGTDASSRACTFRAPDEVTLTPAQCMRLVLPRHGGAVPASRRCSAARPSITGPICELLRHRPAAIAALQPDPHLAPPAGDLLRGHGVPRRRHLPGAADRRPRAARPGPALALPCSAPWCRRVRQPGGEFAGIQGFTRQRHGLATKGGSTSSSAGSGILLIVGMVLWVVIIYRGLRAVWPSEAGNLPWLFFFSALSIPAFYAVGLLAHPADHVRDRRLLAVLGRPPLGRGLSRAVHDDAGGLDLRADGHRLGASRHSADLLRRDALLGRRRGRHAPPRVFQRRAGASRWRSARSSRRPRSFR